MKQNFLIRWQTMGMLVLTSLAFLGTVLVGCSGGGISQPFVPDSAKPYIGTFAGKATLSTARAISLVLNTNASARANGTVTISDPSTDTVIGNTSVVGTVDLANGNFATSGVFFSAGTATDVTISGKLPTGPGNYKLGTLLGSGTLARTDATPTPTPTATPTPTPSPTPTATATPTPSPTPTP